MGEATEAFLPSDAQRSRQVKPTESVVQPPPTFYSTWIKDWWLAEIVSLVLGTVDVISMYIVLSHYDEEPAPAVNRIMGWGITLNTVISILSTVGRVSLLFPVAGCIGQQKWAWFSGTDRPLTDLETFDQGSRGAFGSLMLLWAVKAR